MLIYPQINITRSAASQVETDFPNWRRCCWCQFIKNTNSKGMGSEQEADASWEAAIPSIQGNSSMTVKPTLPCDYELQIRNTRGKKATWLCCNPAALIPGDTATGPGEAALRLSQDPSRGNDTDSCFIPNPASLLLHPKPCGQINAALEEQVESIYRCLCLAKLFKVC